MDFRGYETLSLRFKRLMPASGRYGLKRQENVWKENFWNYKLRHDTPRSLATAIIY